MPYRRIAQKRWPARDEVRALAREHTVEAMNQLIDLMKKSKSHFVKLNAARSVLLCGQPETPQRSPRFKRVGPTGLGEVNVTITKFKEEGEGGSDNSDMPVVPGRRKGSRDAGDGRGAGLPKVRRKRKGVRDESGERDGAKTSLQGTGAEARDTRGPAATGTHGGGEESEASRRKIQR